MRPHMHATNPSPDRLLELVAAIEKTRVLMLADLVLDRFIIGQPSRISREAPVLILQQEAERCLPGGGANAAVGVAALGAEVHLLGAVGEDDAGKDLVALLTEAGVHCNGIETVATYATPTKTRVVGHGIHAMPQQIVRYDREDRIAAAPSYVVEGDFDLLLVSDYGYGAASPDSHQQVCQQLDPLATTVVDSRYRLGDYRGITGATPNQEEVERCLDRSIEDAPADAALDLRRRLDSEFLLLTRGNEGMILATEEGTRSILAHGTTQVADVTGAGDTVLAAFGAAIAAGASPFEAASIANYAGGVVVTKSGTATVTAAELQTAIEGDRHNADRGA